jgi:hypothetical protein
MRGREEGGGKRELSGKAIKPIYQKPMLCTRVRSSFPSFSSPFASLRLSRDEEPTINCVTLFPASRDISVCRSSL